VIKSCSVNVSRSIFDAESNGMIYFDLWGGNFWSKPDQNLQVWDLS